MSGFGRKAKRLAWGNRFFGKNCRARTRAITAKSSDQHHRFHQTRFEQLEDRRLLAPVIEGMGEISGSFLPGSLIYHRSIVGEISSTVEDDSFVVELDQDQTITAVVNASELFQPGVYICGPDGSNIGSAASSAPGEKTVAQTISVREAGSYTIHVYGLNGSTGTYDAVLTFNAAEEQENPGEATNNLFTNAESIDASFIGFSGGAAFRGAVVGKLAGTSTDEDWFSFTLDAGSTASLLLAADPGESQGQSPTTGNRPQLELFDAQGTRLALGVDVDIKIAEDTTVLGHSIEHFVAASDSTFYARVVGQDLNYTLVVTADAALDLGNNSNSTLLNIDQALPPWEGGPSQDISDREGVLGEIGNIVSGWTFMIYLDADNNLEGAGIEDFLEMSSVGSTEDVNIVVQFDRAFSYDYSYDNWTGARRGLVNQGDVPDLNWGNDIGEVDMGNPQTVIDFVEWSMEEYPAGNYALIYWDHGNGFEGICTDSSSGDELEMTDLVTVIDATESVNLVGFDACLMGMTEVAYQYRNGADVMLASEATEWLDGWEYQNFLDDLVADPTMSAEILAGHIIDAFGDRYDADGDSTLSAIDLARMVSVDSPFISGINQFSDWMTTSATTDDWDAVDNASDTAKRWSEPNYIDLGDFITRIGQSDISPELSAIVDQLLDALDSVVLENYGGISAPNTGLSIYLPQLFGYVSSGYNEDLDFVADTHWDDFITASLPSTLAVSTSAASRFSGLPSYMPQVYGPLEPVIYGPVLSQSADSIIASLLRPYSSSTHRKGWILDGSTQSDSSTTPKREATSAEDAYFTGDWYSVEVAAGDWLTVWTTTPGDGDFDFRNTFDPYIELYDPNGQLLTSDDNTVYGRNALISHSAETSGRYWIRVDASPLYPNSTGQYFLRVLEPEGPSAPLSISSTSLPDGTQRSETITSVMVVFSDQLLLSTLDASALTIDGTIEAAGYTVLNGNTVHFDLPVDIGEGSHTLEIAAGSIYDIQGTPVTAYTSSFEIDTSPPRIVESSIQQGDLLLAGQLVYQATFDQSLRVENLDPTDVLLVGSEGGQIAATALNYNPDTKTVSVEFSSLGEDNYSLRLLSGDGHFEDTSGTDLDGEATAFPIGPNTSGDGLPGGDFIVEFSTEIESLSIPGPVQDVLPAGSLVRLLTATGSVGQSGDIDTFTIELQAGQTLATVLHSSETLVSMLIVTDPGGGISTSVAQTPGQNIFHQATATMDGTYEVLVTGTPDTLGDYDLQVIVNACVELETYTEISNNTVLTAQILDGNFINLTDSQGATPQRAAVIGSLADEPGDDFYSFSLAAQQTASIALNSNGSGKMTFELIDSAGNLLSISAESENADAAIHGFTTSTAGTYYLRVIGESEYSMVVTRGAEFDLESNDTLLDAQDITNAGGVLGFIDVSSDEDWYRLAVDAGQTIEIETFLPLNGSGLLASSLNPAIELYDPQGNIVIADSDSAVDGINAIVIHEAAQTGSYKLRVLAEQGQGGYYVSMDLGDSFPGYTAPSVIATDLDNGATIAFFPMVYTADFSEQLLLTSLQPGDLTVEGMPALNYTVVDGDTISFELDPQLYTTHGDGVYQVLLGAGAVTDLQGVGNQEYAGTFTVDTTGPRIIATTWNGQSFPANSELPAGRLEFEAVFDEDLYVDTEIRPTDVLDPNNVLLVEASSSTLYSPDEISYDLQTDRYKVVYDYLPHGSYVFVLLSQDGGFEDAVGNDLDGEFGPGLDGAPTGDGIPGGSYSTIFNIVSNSHVVGRHIFYNNSQWDGDETAPGVNDDPAIATDKSPLLPGETAVFANYTSYDKGINGIMIDVDNLLPTIDPDVDDFTFRVGNNADTGTWSEAPEPSSITLRRGEGVGGSDRITVIWDDGAITKQWLQVTLSGQRLGLPADDVFYWGNAIGEVGDHPTQALVNATDILAARDNPQQSPGETTITNPYDFNRDGFVNATDVTIAQLNKTSPLTALRMIEAPFETGGEAASRSDSSDEYNQETLIDLILRDGLF
ncbi:MAG: pre-peptidase C-terminal domain-containing protein [Pirellulales bacterium]|nr:pre-peptidase C-terminal domain-containing protein [Pirellulales bacterium]